MSMGQRQDGWRKGEKEKELIGKNEHIFSENLHMEGIILFPC